MKRFWILKENNECVCVCEYFIYWKARFPETRQKVSISNVIWVHWKQRVEWSTLAFLKLSHKPLNRLCHTTKLKMGCWYNRLMIWPVEGRKRIAEPLKRVSNIHFYHKEGWFIYTDSYQKHSLKKKSITCTSNDLFNYDQFWGFITLHKRVRWYIFNRKVVQKQLIHSKLNEYSNSLNSLFIILLLIVFFLAETFIYLKAWKPLENKENYHSS